MCRIRYIFTQKYHKSPCHPVTLSPLAWSKCLVTGQVLIITSCLYLCLQYFTDVMRYIIQPEWKFSMTAKKLQKTHTQQQLTFNFSNQKKRDVLQRKEEKKIWKISLILSCPISQLSSTSLTEPNKTVTVQSESSQSQSSLINTMAALDAWTVMTWQRGEKEQRGRGVQSHTWISHEKNNMQIREAVLGKTVRRQRPAFPLANKI